MDGVPDTSYRASCLTEDLKEELLSVTYGIRLFLNESDPLSHRPDDDYPREIRDDYYLNLFVRGRKIVRLEKFLYCVDDYGDWAIVGYGLHHSPTLTAMTQDITDLQEICELARRFVTDDEPGRLGEEEPVAHYVHERLRSTNEGLISTNKLLNIVLESMHATIDRLQEEIMELKLRPPEIGGEVFIAAKQHFEESVNSQAQ